MAIRPRPTANITCYPPDTALAFSRSSPLPPATLRRQTHGPIRRCFLRVLPDLCTPADAQLQVVADLAKGFNVAAQAFDLR